MIFISYINQGINNIGGLSYFEAICHSTNLVPLNNISIKQCIISFVQFMPLGYLLPRVFSKLNSVIAYLKYVLAYEIEYSMVCLNFCYDDMSRE